MKPTLHIIVPAYNCSQFLPRCLDSIAAQTHKPTTVTIIDDASTDPAQVPMIGDYCARHDWFGIMNSINIDVVGNMWRTQRMLNPDPDDVIVTVDGDDWLAHEGALAKIADAYSDPEVWLAYGSYAYFPDESYMPNPALPYPPEVIAANGFRHHNVLFNHPRTWRSFLWQRIAEWELKDTGGEWPRGAGDFTMMTPMLEMSGRHTRCLPDVLYTYNSTNPLSHVRLQERITASDRMAALVRSRAKRDPIPDDHIRNPRRKRNMLLKMRDQHGIRTLVETGTGMGDGIDWLYRHFDSVYTIEIDPTSHAAAKVRHRGLGTICFILGDSAVEVPKLVQSIRGPAIWFLDGHWSGGSGVRGPKDTPVVEELQAIFAWVAPSIVVIDDARLFGTDPAYPTVAEIKQRAGVHRYVWEQDDMIVIEPW